MHLSEPPRLTSAPGMPYKITMRDDGWAVLDPVSKSVARLGAFALEGLTVEEAHVLLGMLEARDRLSVAHSSAYRGLPTLSPPAR